MFYTPRKRDHGLPHDPFKAIVAPRPIGWISSLDPEGRPNLAPYSFFNAIAANPDIVMFSSSGRKDSVENIEATGDFVCNLATWDLREAMNTTSATVARDVNEFELSGLTMTASKVVKAPRVAEAAASLECKLVKSEPVRDLDGRESGWTIVMGEVVGVHLDERLVRDGRFEINAAQAIARCGYMDYAVVREVFAMSRPKTP